MPRKRYYQYLCGHCLRPFYYKRKINTVVYISMIPVAPDYIKCKARIKEEQKNHTKGAEE